MVVMNGIGRWLKFEWWMVSGRLAYKGLRYQTALRCFQRVIELYPKHLKAQSYIGACYMALLRYGDAVTAFERGLQIKSDSSYCHAEMGRACLSLLKSREAIESLNRAFRINPNYKKRGTYVLALADAYAQSANYKSACKFYEDAVRLLPGSAVALHGLGWALRKLGRVVEAEAPLRKAISLEPDDPATHYELGVALYDMERWTEAEHELRRAIKLDPENPDQHTWLGIILGRQGRFKEEVLPCLEAIRLNPGDDEAYFSLGIAYCMLGNVGDALKAYESSLRLSSAPSASLLACTAAAYGGRKKWDELLRISEQFVNQYPEEFDAHFYLGFAYAGLDRNREAIEAYERALQLQPDSFYAVANKALSLLELDMLSEAVATLQRAIELNPEDSEIHLKFGETCAKMGRMAEAGEQLRILEDAGSDSARELAGIIAAASPQKLLAQTSHRG